MKRQLGPAAARDTRSDEEKKLDEFRQALLAVVEIAVERLTYADLREAVRRSTRKRS